MKKRWFAVALACAAIAMPSLAVADDAMSGGGAMKHDAMASGAMATMICRKAAANEKPTATMAGAAKTAMVCKAVAPEVMMKKGSRPDRSHPQTADQVDAAWRAYLQTMMQVPGGTGGG